MPDPRPDLGHWPLPVAHAPLEASDVHVWVIELDVGASRAEELHSLLSEEERERAARFKFLELRRRFTVSHAGVRCILGRYVGVDPARLVFQCAERGKPSLRPLRSGFGRALPQFNLSHSSELALLAVSSRVVGVDIEREDWKDSLEDVATRYFSPRECGLLRNAAASAKAECFFRLWTMKEAILKATGEGIRDLTGVEVLPELSVTGDEVDASRWTLHELPPITGFGAALAVEGTGARVSCFRWEG